MEEAPDGFTAPVQGKERGVADLKAKILVVDDFSTMRRIIKNILKQLGYNEICEAENGLAALEILKTENIDLIISDWNMPQMSGIEFLKAVRGSDAWKNKPFLMVTAEGKKEQVLEAVKHKVTNYIVKPFTAETLLEKLNKSLEAKQ
jgi:two-component system, chemotaxis family, chemotaxis protein CheY